MIFLVCAVIYMSPLYKNIRTHYGLHSFIISCVIISCTLVYINMAVGVGYIMSNTIIKDLQSRQWLGPTSTSSKFKTKGYYSFRIPISNELILLLWHEQIRCMQRSLMHEPRWRKARAWLILVCKPTATAACFYFFHRSDRHSWWHLFGQWIITTNYE